MPDLVHQIGELFLGAVPVALIVLVFYFVLRSLFFQPLLKVMAERDARTLGAQKSAEAAQTAAAEKIKQYEEALKQARAKVYTEQEAERKKLMDERAAFLKEARAKAAAEVNAGKQGVEKEFAAAKKEMRSDGGATVCGNCAAGVAVPHAPASPAKRHDEAPPANAEVGAIAGGDFVVCDSGAAARSRPECRRRRQRPAVQVDPLRHSCGRPTVVVQESACLRFSGAKPT